MIASRSGFRGAWVLVAGAALLGPAPLPAQVIQTVDYSDTFTVAEQGGVPERTDGVYNTGSPAYDVEDLHGNALATWTPSGNFSINTGLGTTCCGYATNEGNDGAATGLAQSGGGDFSFAYGLRTDYVVELDAILPSDRLDISSVPSPGAGIGSAPSLSVFLRKDSVAGTPHGAFPETGLPGIGLYNGSKETAVTDPAGGLVLIGVNDALWHRYAVHFNQDEKYLRIFADGEFLTKIDLNTFAGGLYADFSNAAVGAGGNGGVFWIDNVSVGEPAPPPTSACITAGPRSGFAPLAVDFDASCSFISGAAQSWSWDFGDGQSGSGQTVQHTYAVEGSYQVTLTLTDTGGHSSTATDTITVYEVTSTFSDDFDRADGPVSGWTVYSVEGAWNLAAGELTVGPTAAEHWIWAGDPPIVAAERTTLEFDMRFLGPGSNPDVGRHAGAVFCGSQPTYRSDGGFNGYFVDWIDREADRGPRFTRVDHGALVEIIRGQASGVPVPAEPPLSWKVVITGQTIQVYGDDAFLFEVVDATYRGGYLGLWTYADGQQVAFDNVSVSPTTVPLNAAFTYAPVERLLPGIPVSFDASASESPEAEPITAYEWDFGDGSTGAGVTAIHEFTAPGDYMVTLTVRAGAASDTAEATVSVGEPIPATLVPFADCFDTGPGAVEGWTAALGDWVVNDEGEVETTTTASEAFLYAGNPPEGLPADFVAEVDWRLIAGTNATVGRHAGVDFFWNLPTTDRFAADSRGYNLFYIDRANDRGLSLLRFDGAGYVVLNPPGGTPDLTEPPAKVRIEVSGPTIRVFADEVLEIEVDDATYRDGYFALFVWQTNQVAFDDVRIGATELPDCGGVPPQPRFVRGDTNADGAVNLTDPVVILNYLFLGAAEPSCLDAADVDDSNEDQPNITDAIRLLGWLFLGGQEPSPPGPSSTTYEIGDCGIDPTMDAMECASFPPCG